MSALLDTVAESVTRELIINRSRFIASVFPVTSLADAESIIAATRKEHWSANHNCLAMIIGEHGELQRSSDDGEPSGTAGVPMLEVLRRRNLTDVLVIVTRYFGGVLLGAGGLVRAYSGAVSAVLDDAQILERQLLTEITISVDYGLVGRLENTLRNWVQQNGAVFTEPNYGRRAQFNLLVPEEMINVLRELALTSTGGAAELEVGAQRIFDVKL